MTMNPPCLFLNVNIIIYRTTKCIETINLHVAFEHIKKIKKKEGKEKNYLIENKQNKSQKNLIVIRI